MRLVYGRMRDLIVRRILGVADTPQRIAFGVFLGFLVAWTPTLGFQIVLYLAIASLLRANKVAGIPVLFISNPFTAVPVYYACWRVGSWLLHFGAAPVAVDRAEVAEQIAQGSEAAEGFWTQIMSLHFWRDLLDTFVSMGAEMWLGSLVLGVVTGIVGYFATLYGVRAYRAARGLA